MTERNYEKLWKKLTASMEKGEQAVFDTYEVCILSICMISWLHDLWILSLVSEIGFICLVYCQLVVSLYEILDDG